jgi:hypothetical protein
MQSHGHDGPYHLLGQGITDPGRVTQQNIALEFTGLGAGNAGMAEGSETRDNSAMRSTA